MIFIFTAVSAIAPSLLIVWYFHKRDAFPEPARVLWATFGLGVLTVFPVVVIELLIQEAVDLAPGAVLRGALDAFCVAAFTEESFKLLVLLVFVWRHRDFDEPMDGIVYGVVASLGFATLENVLYVFQSGMGIAILRALTAVPSHATEGAILGYFVGQAKFARSGRAATIFTGLAASILIHGLYDFPLLSLSAGAEIAKSTGVAASDSIALLLPCTLITLGAAGWWAIRLTRKLRREQLCRRDIFAAGPVPALAGGAALGRSYLQDPRQAHAAPAPWPQPAALVPSPAPFVPQPSPPMASAAPPSPAPPCAARPQPAPRPGRGVALAALAGGFILGSGGGMVALAIIGAFAMNQVAPSEASSVILGTVLIGVLPMIAGAALFTVGIARLNQA